MTASRLFIKNDTLDFERHTDTTVILPVTDTVALSFVHDNGAALYLAITEDGWMTLYRNRPDGPAGIIKMFDARLGGDYTESTITIMPEDPEYPDASDPAYDFDELGPHPYLRAVENKE